MRCRWCVGFACEVDAKCGTHNTVIPKRAGHRQLRAAHRLHGEGDSDRRRRGRATGVAYFDAEDGCRSRPPTS